MLNFFRIIADISHLLSIIVLIQTIRKKAQIEGISFKTQTLYAIVYFTRYIDLFMFKKQSFYNLAFKLTFLGTSLYTLHLMKKCNTVNPVSYNDMITKDTFQIRYCVAFAALMALLFHYKFTFTQLSWSFSIWLESICIIPQMFLLQKLRKADAITSHYIFLLGIYRLLYIPNWIWRYVVEERFEKISFFAGILQTIVFSDFFYIYFTRITKGKSFQLPH
ncbi:hypothetical protein QEN19_001062 [Hanseniaspora menglaensis]